MYVIAYRFVAFAFKNVTSEAGCGPSALELLASQRDDWTRVLEHLVLPDSIKASLSREVTECEMEVLVAGVVAWRDSRQSQSQQSSYQDQLCRTREGNGLYLQQSTCSQSDRRDSIKTQAPRPAISQSQDIAIAGEMRRVGVNSEEIKRIRNKNSYRKR
ncbi:hypothetical protein U1Q18_048088, partial [Sarracenia purpurea var. burkii]